MYINDIFSVVGFCAGIPFLFDIWHQEHSDPDPRFPLQFFRRFSVMFAAVSSHTRWKRWNSDVFFHSWVLLLMEEILHQLISSLSLIIYKVLYIPGGGGFLPTVVRMTPSKKKQQAFQEALDHKGSQVVLVVKTSWFSMRDPGCKRRRQYSNWNASHLCHH